MSLSIGAFEAFVWTYNDMYLAFSSYGKATASNNPLTASLYQSESTAKRRIRDCVYIDGKPIKFSNPKIKLKKIIVNLNDIVEI